MKHYIQDGMKLKRTSLMESGYICECCEDYLHASNEEHSALEDDVECPQCGALCACKCHREKK
jgi:hypothetical protein